MSIVDMGRRIRLLVILTIGIPLVMALPVNAASLGGKCTKTGMTQITKGVSYICIKSGKKNVWKVKPSLVKSNSSTSTSTSTSTTTIPLYSDPEITSVNNLLNVQECRISDVTSNLNSGGSTGFPRPNSIRGGLGQPEVLVIPVNFSDLPFSAADAKGIEENYSKANAYFSAMSYGGPAVKMTIAASSSWVDVGGTVEQNGLINSPQHWDGSSFYRKVVAIYLSNNSISGFDVVEVVAASSSRFSIGQALPSGSNSIYGTNQSFSGMLDLGVSMTTWSVLTHELGHAWLGFEDLYLYKGGFPLGNWDLMSMSGKELSGWSRFLAGWIDSNWVRCASPRSQSRHYLSSLNSGKSEDRPRMLVIPINLYTVVVAELRVPNEWQKDIISPTLVVYRVDTSFAHLNGPITLVGTMNQKNGTVSTDGVIISVIGMDNFGVIIEVKN